MTQMMAEADGPKAASAKSRPYCYLDVDSFATQEVESNTENELLDRSSRESSRLEVGDRGSFFCCVNEGICAV
jgi:hypothetical protein